MVPRRACIQGVLKVTVEVKGHVIGALFSYHENRFFSRANARTEDNVAEVGEMTCSQENASGTHSSIREIASELNISRSSVHRIAKDDLKLNSFRRVLAQVLNDATRENRLCRAQALLRRMKMRDSKRIFFTD